MDSIVQCVQNLFITKANSIMPANALIAQLTPQITTWRRDFHENPELGYDVHRTAGIVADKLKQFGADEIVTGIGRTGVVGIIKGKSVSSGRVIGLRADMDALPIQEQTNKPYASKVQGKMHACGHDGHTAMLLGAAQYLCMTRDFNGIAVVIFQPAEEGGAGAKAMLDDGLMERFNIQEVYGMHNMPGIPLGHIAMRAGPMMAAADQFTIQIEGKGGHAAKPDKCVDSVLVAAQIINMLQSVVSRNVDPLHSAVLSITCMNAGDAFNVIPQTAKLVGTVRTLNEAVRASVEAQMRRVIAGTAQAFGATASLHYERGYPVTINHADQTEFATQVARNVVGADKVDTSIDPMMGAEDFAYMLQARPGAYVFLGNGDTPFCHHPAFDFDDTAIPTGVGFWVGLIEAGMPAK
jgi:amidohydrolase